MTSIPDLISRDLARIDARLEDQRTGIGRAGDIPGRVARGVALLDEKVPGWVDQIDLDKLDLGSSCNCILGQTWDEPYDPKDEDAAYFGHVARLFGDLLNIRAEVACGFNAEDESEFPALTAEWRRVIIARRAQADPVRQDTNRIADALGDLGGVALTDDERAVLTEAVTEIQAKDGDR